MACTPLSVSVFVLMALSGLFWVIGAATDNMFYIGRLHFKFFNSDASKYDWWQASQAMCLIGLLCLGGAALVSLLTICCKNLGRRLILILQAAALFASAGFVIVGVIIFASKLYDSYFNILNPTLGYSFGLLCVSGVLSAIGGIVTLVDMIKGD